MAPAHNKKNAKFFARRLSQPERKKLRHFFCCEQGPQGAIFFDVFVFFLRGVTISQNPLLCFGTVFHGTVLLFGYRYFRNRPAPITLKNPTSTWFKISFRFFCQSTKRKSKDFQDFQDCSVFSVLHKNTDVQTKPHHFQKNRENGENKEKGENLEKGEKRREKQ